MARVLIAEPSADVRTLLDRAVRRLGHEPVTLPPGGGVEDVDADVLLLEPALSGGVALARELRQRHPGLQIVICSILPPSSALRALDPTAHVMKPFERGALEEALSAAIDACYAA